MCLLCMAVVVEMAVAMEDVVTFGGRGRFGGCSGGHSGG
jgi:hypothetical protein